MMSRALVIAIYCILCLIWSSTWLMIKIGLQGAPPVTGAALRFIIAALIVYAILLKRRIPLPRTRRFLLLSVFLGFFQMGIPYALVYWGEQYISSGLTAILFSTMPFWVAILARPILGDPLTAAKISGICSGIVGVYVIFSDSISLGGDNSALGVAAVVGSAFLASISSVIVKKYSGPYHPFASLFMPKAVGGLLLVLWSAFFEDGMTTSLDALTIASILYLGIFGSVVAFALYFWIIKHIDVTILSYQGFVIPILACLLGWIFIGETITIKVMIGAVLILGGIALATLTATRRRVIDGAHD